MTSKRKLYREEEKLFFLHSYYQSGMSKHAFCRAHGICCPALLNSWIKKYLARQGNKCHVSGKRHAYSYLIGSKSEEKTVFHLTIKLSF